MKTKPLELVRSALFVPGNRESMIAKAMGTKADMVIIDWEDAVPLSEKETARAVTAEKLRPGDPGRIMIRVNALESDNWAKDLEAVIQLGVNAGVDALMLPKAQTAADIKAVNEKIISVERTTGSLQRPMALVPLIESALGVENAFIIAATAADLNRPCGMAFGAADFCLDMGIEMSGTGQELIYARSRITTGCRAAGIRVLLDSPFMTDLKDRNAFEAEVLTSRLLGFSGKLCIHPSQIDYCNEAFFPLAGEVDLARTIVEAFIEAKAKGIGAIRVGDKFIDEPVANYYKQILKISNRMKTNFKKLA